MLPVEQIAELLQPYLSAVEPSFWRVDGQGDAVSGPEWVPDWTTLYARLAIYLELLTRWNGKMNLTAIREPEEIVRRHFGESVWLGLQIGPCASLLDFGSGGGFPGIPVQLVRPELRVALAESQQKKAAFLREAVRVLGLPTEVWGDRVEAMPRERRFDAVVMRAVDKFQAAKGEASARAEGWLLLFATPDRKEDVAGFQQVADLAVPESSSRRLLVFRRG